MRDSNPAQREGCDVPRVHLAEDAGFEPCPERGARCPASALGGGCGIRTREGVNPTRFPSERHRPLGESSAGEGTGPPGRPAELGGTRGATYTADNPPCGGISPNSPRAGRQQGSVSSAGCAGGLLLPPS